ncbi:hypothetical protein GCM10022225_56290 [Plantactinospora mayteni]|uniref:EcsC family protein n=2 Tax=Plantactinospora mayteni TaxID=566021 RepID=A0ABQ4EUJ7_9ACTN|nr:hypothetical protein Pma05_49070 [Plantactinospora mayteni]
MTESQPVGGGTAAPVPPTDRTPPAAANPGTAPDPDAPGAAVGVAQVVGPDADADPAEVDPMDDPEVTVAPPSGLWERMKADPQYAPEHLALEAVRRIGPQAGAWAERTRARYPQMTPEAMAETAVRKFVNHARVSGAISGAAGLPGAVLDMGVLAWTQARMVLYVAAAYGHDPEHPDRATDLLVLQRVHKVAETARLALGVAAGRERIDALRSGSETPLARVMLRLGLKLAQMAGVRAAKRLVAKAVPGAAVVLGSWANSSATKSLAARSRELYRLPAILPPSR